MVVHAHTHWSVARCGALRSGRSLAGLKQKVLRRVWRSKSLLQSWEDAWPVNARLGLSLMSGLHDEQEASSADGAACRLREVDPPK